MLDGRAEDLGDDASEAGNTQARAELMQHPHVRGKAGGTEVRETAPRRLFGQHTGQQVEGMDRAQDGEKVDPEELGRRVATTAARTMRLGPPSIDELVGNERGEGIEEGGGTGLREARRHAKEPTPLDPT